MIFAPQVQYTIPSTFRVSFFRIHTQVVTFFESSNFQFSPLYFSKQSEQKTEQVPLMVMALFFLC